MNESKCKLDSPTVASRDTGCETRAGGLTACPSPNKHRLITDLRAARDCPSFSHRVCADCGTTGNMVARFPAMDLCNPCLTKRYHIAKAEEDDVRRCENCRHFGTLKGIAGVVRATVCLAPADEGERFVYEASPHGECELFTPNSDGDWYHCSVCGDDVLLHKADRKHGCIQKGCWNYSLPLKLGKSKQNNKDDAHE